MLRRWGKKKKKKNRQPVLGLKFVILFNVDGNSISTPQTLTIIRTRNLPDSFKSAMMNNIFENSVKFLRDHN